MRARAALNCTSLLAACLLASCGGTADDSGDHSGFTVNLCSENTGVTGVATQDGDGPWQARWPIDGGTTYRIDFQAQRAAIALNYYYGPSIYYGTPGQLEEYLGSFATRCGARIVSGTVSGVGSDTLYMSLGRYAFGTYNLPDPQVMYMRPEGTGPLDLVGMKFGADVHYILRTGLELANGAVLAPIDFASAEAFASAQATLEVADARGTYTGGYVGFGPVARISPSLDLRRPATYHAFPLAHLPAGTTQKVIIEDFDTTSTERRTAEINFRAVENRTVTLGPSMPPYTVTVRESGAFAFPTVELPSQPEYGAWAFASFWPASSSELHFTSVLVTAEYFGSTPATWVIVIPELAGLPGFQPSSALPAGAPLRYTVAAGGGTRSWPAASFVDISTRPRVDGDEVHQVFRNGITTP